ncbi:hypothetical protein GE21DRAFT_1214617 [Neurospora crassa]|nr:hypothetical protein B14D6.600 [imported] - Neurospora crassa [Neurospora crassa]KHE81956.1 hypothetical protein GE21DRAFT_1214617 [Neurospora crassa]
MTHHLMICPPASATRVHRPLTSVFPVVLDPCKQYHDPNKQAWRSATATASASLLFREYLPTYTARSSRVHHHHNMAFYMSTHLPDSAAHARTHARTHVQHHCPPCTGEPTGRWLLQVKSPRRTIGLSQSFTPLGRGSWHLSAPLSPSTPTTCPLSISYTSIASSHPTLQVLASLQARQG